MVVFRQRDGLLCTPPVPGPDRKAAQVSFTVFVVSNNNNSLYDNKIDTINSSARAIVPYWFTLVEGVKFIGLLVQTLQHILTKHTHTKFGKM